ncbi:calcitonin gene-related peptide 1 [Phodopus roborovskii]|uniref:calcitonin gene-related peptide 1 n=1 Tax=Phodopus roborovskii TaxID=109678 RepID=UPI0021E3A730|nr:calcitonin gene-related peptide 1 [Phodopus roborovskii]
MGFLKFFPFLALSVWILCLTSSLQAAPFRSALKSGLPSDEATLSEQEKSLLLGALVQSYYELMKASKLEQQEQQEQQEQEVKGSSYGSKQLAEDQIISSEKMLKMMLSVLPSIPGQKRACKTATCVTHRLAGILSRSGGMLKNNFVPTNVGSKTYGRRRRDLQA